MPLQYCMVLLSFIGLNVLLSKQWTGKGFDRDLSQLLDLLYLEQSSGKGEMQVLNFNETFQYEFVVTCGSYIHRLNLLHYFELFKTCAFFFHSASGFFFFNFQFTLFFFSLSLLRSQGIPVTEEWKLRMA